MICEHCGVEKAVTLALTGPDGKTWNLCVMHWLDGAFSKKEQQKSPEEAAAEMKGKPAGKSLLTDNEYFYTGESRPRVPSEAPKKKRAKAKDETGDRPPSRQRDAFDDHPNAPGRK